MAEQIKKYAAELQTELSNILSYWMDFTPDDVNGGFVGRIDQNNIIDESAPKGAVLNSNILWSFAAAYNLNPLEEYLEHAARAYHYIANHFIDHEFGGVYWTVDTIGNPLNTKKQTSAVASSIYALSEYFMASGQEVVKDHAIALYLDLIKYGLDVSKSGYLEAFDREWKPLENLPLNDKVTNEKKTLKTHLQVLEALTNLYRIWPDEDLKLKISDLLRSFTNHIIDSKIAHLGLLFDEDWNRKSEAISYGYDIQASWLLVEAAEVIGEEDLIKTFKDLSVKIARASLKGIDDDGAMWYEYKPLEKQIIKEKYWWIQAEAMIGFYNAWQISGDETFLEASLASWGFVKNRIIDYNNGEWFWGIGIDNQVIPDQDKTGPWKSPSQNSRACIEIIKRTQL